MSLNKSIAIIGAGSEIAASLINRLYLLGCTLYLVGRNRERLQLLVDVVKTSVAASNGNDLFVFEGDLSDTDSGCCPFFSWLDTSGRPLNGLVYMAAAAVSGHTSESLAHDEAMTSYTVGAVALHDWIREAAGRMSRGSRIIIASSGAGHNGFAGMPAYCGSKFAEEGIMQAAACDLWRNGIWINTIALPSVKTSFSRPHFSEEEFQSFPEPSEILTPFIKLLQDDCREFSGRSVYVHEHWLKQEFSGLPPLVRYRGMQPPLYPPVRSDLLEQGYSEKMAKVDLGEAPFPPSPKVARAVADWMAYPNSQEYPDPQCRQLKEILSKRHNLSKDHFIVGPGSSVILDWLLDQLVDPGAEAIAGAYCFRVWSWMAQTRGINVLRYENTTLHHDLIKIAAKLSPQTRMIYIDSPSNPMGDIIEENQWRWFLKRLPQHIWIVVDHAYQDFVSESHGVDTTNAEWLQDPRIISVRTISKSHGMAAWRVGYMAAHPATIDLLSGALLPFTVPTPVQIAAQAALNDDAYEEMMLNHYISERKRMRETMDRMGVQYWLGETSFNAIYWPGVSHYYEHARQADIAIPHVDNDTFFIAAIRDRDTNDRVLNFIEQWYPSELRIT